MSFSTVSAFELGLQVQVRGVDETKLHMQQMLPEVRKALEQAIGADAGKMRDRARSLASGEVLQRHTGSFVDSIKSDLKSSENSVFGHVYSEDPRDGIFEYGGEQEPRDILPSARQALHFLGGSALLHVLSLGTAGMVFAAVVHRPVVHYEKRPVIHRAFDEMEPAVERDIESASHKVIIDWYQRL